MKSKNNNKLDKARLELAEKEYLYTLVTTGSFLDAELTYQKSLGDLKAKVPEGLELKGIAMREAHLATVDKDVRSLFIKEKQEFDLVHAQLRRLLLMDEIAEEGIPTTLSLEVLKELEPRELTEIMKGLKSLQEIRRNMLGIDQNNK